MCASDCRGFDPVLGVTLEAECIDYEAGGIHHVPSLDKSACVGLDGGLLDGVAHDVPRWLVADASIVSHHRSSPVTFETT